MPGVPVPVELPADGYACVLDPLDVLSHLAALTHRVQLGTSAVLALLQPPVLLARRLATVDQLSHGRVVAGLAAGWMSEEFAAAGTPAGNTGQRLEAHLAALRAVWGPDPVDIPPANEIPLLLRGFETIVSMSDDDLAVRAAGECAWYGQQGSPGGPASRAACPPTARETATRWCPPRRECG
jgi:alkanesulfonate monooxygenase SsuD/methylene tetrahydromethanopterin reductase-like flavin-dependent oxidoreductase (luciferase family)